MAAFDVASGDNVNVIPYTALVGDPTDPDVLAKIKAALGAASTGFTPVTVDAVPGDVHGFPAATVTVNAIYAGNPMTAVSTVIQTGDHVYQLSVTSQSAERAAILSAQIVPTFAPV